MHNPRYFTSWLKLACIDKWVKSKFEDAHSLALCSGSKLAIWNQNQPPRPEKTPGHGEKCKMVILLLSAPGGHWEKRKQIHIMTLVQLFSIHMTSIHPRHLPDTLRHHPDTTQTPPDTIQTPPDIGVFTH